MNMIKMECPACGGALRIELGQEKTVCEYCGQSYLLKDSCLYAEITDFEQAGYKFEKGRQRAKEEGIRNNKSKYKRWLIPGLFCMIALFTGLYIARSLTDGIKERQPVEDSGHINRDVNETEVLVKNELQTVSAIEDSVEKETMTALQSEDVTSNLQSNSEVVILNHDTYVEITKAGFSISGGCLLHSVVLHNSSNNQALRFPQYRVTAKDADGKILGTEQYVLNIIYPDRDYVCGDIGFEMTEYPAVVEFEMLEADEWDMVETTLLDKKEYLPLEVENIFCRKEDGNIYTYTGEIYNPNQYQIDEARVSVIIKDTDGKMLGGSPGFVDHIKAGGKVPFSVTIYSDHVIADSDIFANSWDYE